MCERTGHLVSERREVMYLIMKRVFIKKKKKIEKNRYFSMHLQKKKKERNPL